MAFLSTLLNHIPLLLLLCAELQSTGSAKRSEKSRSSKRKPSDSEQLNLNSRTNPFLANRTVPGSDRVYQGNPFLTGDVGGIPNITEPSVPVNQPKPVQDGPGNIYFNNPFLQPDLTNRDDEQDRPTPQPTQRPKAQPTQRPIPQQTPRPVPEPLQQPDLPTSNPNIIIWPEETVTSLPSLPIGPIRVSNPIPTFRTKSDIKCEEYSRQLVDTAELGTLAGTGSSVIKVSNEACRSVTRLIIGGTKASLGEFPHMVALGRQTADTFDLYCGASLISPSWVLTAAHCTYGPLGRPNLAKLGCINLKNDQDVVEIGVKTVLRHPAYSDPAKYADIGLIELENSVTFSSTIRPACLYEYYDTVPAQTWASGWGVTEFGGLYSDDLLKVLLHTVDNVACSLKYNSSLSVPHGVSPSMICAGDPRGGWSLDTCQGDSGGPLQIIHPRNRCLFQIVGITSFGDGCAVTESPGVYIRVAHYLPWIESIVWPDN